MTKDSLLSVADTYYGNEPCLDIVFPYMLELGTKDKDKHFLAETYRLMAYTYDGEKSLAYADSLVMFSPEKSDYRYASAYYTRGTVHYYNENPTAAINDFQVAYEKSLEIGTTDLSVLSLNIIGMIKSEYSNDKNSILLHQQAKRMIKDLDLDDTEKADIEIYTNDKIAIYHLRAKDPDSALYYIKQSQDLMNKYQLDELQNSFQILEGQAYYFKEEYYRAEEILREALKESDGLRSADILYYLGDIEGRKGNQQGKLKTFQSIDSIMDQEDGPIDTTDRVYLYLLENAKKTGDIANQLIYYDKLINYDSIIKANRNEIGDFDPPGYSINDLINSRNELLVQNKKRGNWIIVVVILLAIAMLTVFYFVQLYKKTARKLQEQLSKEVKPIPVKKPIAKNEKESQSVEIAFQKLKNWEKKQGYLDKDVNQNTLAKILGTNTSYLSKAVKEYIGQDFRVYLADLRITNLINTTRENYEVPKKSIISIIEEFGFNSIDSFSRALKSKLNDKNITPAMYFREISKRNL
ncbi:MAG: hypothetical protein AAF039_15425 [Bacteroidota bacterium]